MLRSAANLQGYTIEATDGDIGQLDRLFFDDTQWTVRYLVVDTGKWLPGRKVLIPPVAVERIDRVARRIHLQLTREKIKTSPDVDSDQPVSRQQESALSAYYGYGPYGMGDGLWGSASYPPGMLAPLPPAAAAFAPPPAVPGGAASAHGDAETPSGDPHLRSTKEVAGYHVKATDDEIGHVDDFLIDESWAIRSVVVDTSNWPGGRSVLISPENVRQIDWLGSIVHVGISAAQVRSSPPYESADVR